MPDPGPGLARNQESTNQENGRHRPNIRARRIEADAKRLDVGIVARVNGEMNDGFNCQ